MLNVIKKFGRFEEDVECKFSGSGKNGTKSERLLSCQDFTV